MYAEEVTSLDPSQANPVAVQQPSSRECHHGNGLHVKECAHLLVGFYLINLSIARANYRTKQRLICYIRAKQSLCQ
jgi:hypothetical protein